jgi:hypothetical protein
MEPQRRLRGRGNDPLGVPLRKPAGQVSGVIGLWKRGRIGNTAGSRNYHYAPGSWRGRCELVSEVRPLLPDHPGQCEIENAPRWAIPISMICNHDASRDFPGSG